MVQGDPEMGRDVSPSTTTAVNADAAEPVRPVSSTMSCATASVVASLSATNVMVQVRPPNSSDVGTPTGSTERVTSTSSNSVGTAAFRAVSMSAPDTSKSRGAVVSFL